tara:strand:- start:241 stop:1026 length:786 start_codon:yes stop_codon:yes gene_type:complete
MNLKNLKGKSLYVTTPMYGNQCNGGFMQSCMRLQRLCLEYEIPFEFYIVFNESLVTRARNTCVKEFLKTDFTHMMFIDADIVFDPMDVIKMLSYNDKDIICGTYSKKRIRWDRVMEAYSKGFISKNSDPEKIENFTGDFFFSPIGEKMSMSDPVEVEDAGTGFMMIRRDCFDKFKNFYPELNYVQDSDRSGEEIDSAGMFAYFDTVIDPDSKRYLSEDYMFCRYARKAGMKVWVCPWIKLQHIGNYTFKGNFPSTIGLLTN